MKRKITSIIVTADFLPSISNMLPVRSFVAAPLSIEFRVVAPCFSCSIVANSESAKEFTAAVFAVYMKEFCVSKLLSF